MANPWLRLWNEMPNDPKWRTIARASGQSIGNVLAVYLHLLVNASNATERGRTENVCSEDIASALDIDEPQVDAILAAMQGRVMDGDHLSGWEKRQPEREDGSAVRAKAWREAKKAEKSGKSNAPQTTPNAEQTHANAAERIQPLDTDKDKKREDKKGEKSAAARQATPLDAEVSAEVIADYLAVRKAKKAGPLTDTAIAGLRREATKAGISVADAVAFCCEAGWQGFNAEWYANRLPKAGRVVAGSPNKQEALEQRNRSVASAWANEGVLDEAT